MNSLLGFDNLDPELIQQISYILQSLPEKKQALLFELILNLPKEDYKSKLTNAALKLLKDNPMFVQWFIEIVKNLEDVPLRKFVQNFIVNSIIVSHKKRKEYLKEHGFETPMIMVINPTMRCNLKCNGCYSWKFSKAEDMDYNVLKKLLNESKELKTYFIIVSGGEPFLYEHYFDMAKDFPDHIFMTYTNSTLLNDERIKKIAELGNIWPILSIEGFEKETDTRRGQGMFNMILETMRKLKEHGIMFGFSATPTKNNSDIIASDEFIDFYIKQGILLGWMFTYIPVGKNPDINLMATPQQRNKLREMTQKWKKTKPILIGDFWNDSPCVGGCLSASRYLFITNEGFAQPCTFVHFYTHNVKDHTLKEIWESPFFNAIRNRQPYDTNLLKPCKVIDNPQVLREIIEETGAKPSYEGADAIIKNPEITKHLDNYSKQWEKIAEKAWYSPEYGGGHSILAPFLGRVDAYKFWPERMDVAVKQLERNQNIMPALNFNSSEQSKSI